MATYEEKIKNPNVPGEWLTLTVTSDITSPTASFDTLMEPDLVISGAASATVFSTVSPRPTEYDLKSLEVKLIVNSKTVRTFGFTALTEDTAKRKKIDGSWSHCLRCMPETQISVSARAIAVYGYKLERSVAEPRGPITVDLPKDWLAWERIEPRCRTDDFMRGLQARTADPAWFLARQWQTGEFKGEDAGSPLEVSLRYYSQTVNGVRLRERRKESQSQEEPQPQEKTWRFGGRPLERWVEEEWLGLDWRTRARIGQQFERLARASLSVDQAQVLIDEYRAKYPLKPPSSKPRWRETDYDTRRFLQFMDGRVIDGREIMRLIWEPPLGEMADGRCKEIVEKLLAWRAALNLRDVPIASGAWRPAQMDYRFQAENIPENAQEPQEDQELQEDQVPQEDQAPPALSTQVRAPNYRNGDLDWYTFNAASGPRGTWDPSWATSRAVPTRVSIGGASPRWWAFEDAALNLGKLEIGEDDLARLMLIQFMLFYTDDWFLVPLAVPTSRLVRLFEAAEASGDISERGVIVRNVFGEDLHINPAQGFAGGEGLSEEPDPLKRWEIFSLSCSDPDFPDVADPDAAGLANVLFLPAVAGFREESPPIEEVRFLRDEGANMVWGIEHIVRNGLGQPVSGFDAQRERKERRGLAEQEQETGGAGVPRYRLATTVPENWIPFLPGAVHDKDLGRPRVRLRRAQMWEESPSMSRLLEGLQEFDEVLVPRSGLRVQLTAQRVRWFDGKTHVWLGRKALAGRGEGSSGLRFDVLS